MDNNKTFVDQPLIWVLKDERPGTGNQAHGVAEALGLKFQVKFLELSKIGRLPNILLGASLHSITSKSKMQILPPWPDLVISAGRRAASVARYIKRRSGGKTFICQIMYPGRSSISEFDLIAVPNHDQISGANIVNIVGAPNQITNALLLNAKSKWREDFGELPEPVVGVIIGGNTNRMPFGVRQADELASLVSEYKNKFGGSLIVTTSRRTGAVAKNLFEALNNINSDSFYFFQWGVGVKNPYLGILAYADTLIVTGDSISMLSEACAAPGNVYIYTPAEFSSVKHLSFHEELYAMKAARPFETNVSNWEAIQFNSANNLAREINGRLGW